MTHEAIPEERKPQALSSSFAAMRPGTTGGQRPASSPTAWMVSFTDLVALMLTFFVLLYSMSRLDMVQWQNLASSLSRSLDSVQESEAVEPRAQLDIAPLSLVPGSDLDYLANMISERLKNDPVLKPAGFRHEGARLVITLPDELLFEAGSDRIGPAAGHTMFALGGILRAIGNTVEIVAYPIETDEQKDKALDGERAPREALWTGGLGRAITLARLLADAGFDGPLRPRGAVRSAVGQAPMADFTHDTTADHGAEVILLDTAGER